MTDFTAEELDTIEFACDVLIDTDWAWRYSAEASAVKDKIEAIRTSRRENVECPDDEILDELAVNFWLYADRQFVRNTSSKTRAWIDARNARSENVEEPSGCIWCKGRTLLYHDCRNFAHFTEEDMRGNVEEPT